MSPPPEVIVRKFLRARDRLFLNPFEADLGRRIGAQRHAIDQQLGLQPHVIHDPVVVCSNDQFGGMAEVAVARWLNVWPMTQFTEFLYYNLKLPGGDLVAVQYNDKRAACVMDHWREARRIEKKKEAPELYLVLTDAVIAERYVSFTFVGWTTHATLLASKSEPLKDYGPRWVCEALHERLDILTCARGQGYGHEPETGDLDFGEEGGAPA